MYGDQRLNIHGMAQNISFRFSTTIPEHRRCTVLTVKPLHGEKVKNLDCSKIAKMNADNGGEYISTIMKEFCKTKGIQLIYTVVSNPEMNGTRQPNDSIDLCLIKLEQCYWRAMSANVLGMKRS